MLCTLTLLKIYAVCVKELEMNVSRNGYTNAKNQNFADDQTAIPQDPHYMKLG
jgi:hypothetical protein